MEERTDMDSIETVMEYLRQNGWDKEFYINPAGDLVLQEKTYTIDKVKLIRTFRFEGETDPSEQSIIYLVETSDGCVGYSKDAYGMYSEHMNDVYSAFINNVHSDT